MIELCPCGRPLHYVSEETERSVRDLIARLGPEIKMVTPMGAWLVPRHYIALHGLKAWELPVLARYYGWRQISIY